MRGILSELSIKVFCDWTPFQFWHCGYRLQRALY